MKPTLVLNPVTDRAFGELALAELVDDVELREYETRLQSRYPHAAVHARVLSDEPTTIWYVYRDGHWTNPSRDDVQRGERDAGR